MEDPRHPKALTFQTVIAFMTSKEEDKDTRKLLRAAIKKNRNLSRGTTASGFTPLQVGIQHEAPTSKIEMLLLADKETARQRNPAGRLPLHMALDFHVKEDVLRLLLDAYDQAVMEPDVDQRLPLHIILEFTPFQQFFGPLAEQMLYIYPDAALVQYVDGRYPLHVALDRCLQTSLTLRIFECAKSVAGIPTKDGRYPLHMALESDFEILIIRSLLEVFPAALLVKIGGSRRMLPLRYAIKHKKNLEILSCLMNGGQSNNPKVIAYARAALTGRLGKESRKEGGSLVVSQAQRGSLVKLKTLQDGGVEVQEVDEMELEESEDNFKCVVQTATGLQLPLLCHTEERVEDLRKLVQAAEARALNLEDHEGTPPAEQRLTLGSTQLLDGFVLSDYGLTRDCTIAFDSRFEILNEALRFNTWENVLTEILRLRPQTAKEEDAKGVLPLHSAILNNASETVVKELIDGHPQAVKMEVVGSLGQYPLHIMLSKGYSCYIIKNVLEAKAFVTREGDWTADGNFDPSGKVVKRGECYLPLHMAIQHSKAGDVIDIITVLLDSRCPIGARHKSTGHSALECMLAAQRFSEDLFEMILGKTREGAPESLSEAGPTGLTPLHVACSRGAPVNIVQRLIEICEESLDQTDTDRQLPLHLALLNSGQFPVVQALINKRPKSVHVRDGQNRTPLQIAVTMRAWPGVVQLIVHTDDKVVHVRDHRRRSIVELAAEADAPVWVLRELVQTCPQQVEDLNPLTGEWPHTKASSELIRLLQEPNSYTRAPALPPALTPNTSSRKLTAGSSPGGHRGSEVRRTRGASVFATPPEAKLPEAKSLGDPEPLEDVPPEAASCQVTECCVA